MASLAGEPFGTLGVNARDPVNRLDVVNQRGLAKQPFLGNERRAVAWLARFAFQGFDQGRFLTANIGSSAAAQDDKAWLDDVGRFQLGHGLFQNTVQAGVFIPEVDVEGFCLGSPGTD